MFLLTNDKSYVIMASKTILGGIHMYTSEKSTKLTLFISYCFCFLLVVIMIGIIPGINWILGGAQFAKVCIAAFYICCPAAWTALYCIIKLLKNILNNDIFSQKSVMLLCNVYFQAVFCILSRCRTHDTYSSGVKKCLCKSNGNQRRKRTYYMRIRGNYEYQNKS